MKRMHLAAVLVVAVVLVAAVAWVFLSNSGEPTDSALPIQYVYGIVKTYPHDKAAFTEGLIFQDGVLYESTGSGEFGTVSSSLREVNLEDGTVQKQTLLTSEYFGEGLTAVDDSLVQLTWQTHIGFIYDKETLALKGNFSYSTEGWGLTYDGSKLIMSDGSSNLYFLDPATYQNTGQISVHDGNTSVVNINELEYVKGDIYANIWLQQKIAIINPHTGAVKGWIDLSGIYQTDNINDVLNGIAYDSQTGRLFITGKDWPNLYQITIIPKPNS